MKDNQTNPAKPLNLLLIGAGGQGTRRARATQLSKGWKLAGVFDNNQELAAEMARKWRCRHFSDATQAISADTIDVVAIATPPASHDDYIIKSIHSGRHVICEKPLTIFPQLAIDYLKEADQKNLIIATGFNHRFYKPVINASELLRSNTIGRLIEINGRIGQRPEESVLNGWMGNCLLSGGGAIVDNGSHLIDLAMLFLDSNISAELIDCISIQDRSGIDEHTELRLTDSHGLQANLKASWNEPEEPYLKLEIKAESGLIRISAFPWRLELDKPGHKTISKQYLFDRITMKGLGFLANGLEMSLVHEMQSIRQSILKLNQVRMKHATGSDGQRIAELIEELKNQAGLSEQKMIKPEQLLKLQRA